MKKFQWIFNDHPVPLTVSFSNFPISFDLIEPHWKINQSINAWDFVGLLSWLCKKCIRKRCGIRRRAFLELFKSLKLFSSRLLSALPLLPAPFSSFLNVFIYPFKVDVLSLLQMQSRAPACLLRGVNKQPLLVENRKQKYFDNFPFLLYLAAGHLQFLASNFDWYYAFSMRKHIYNGPFSITIYKQMLPLKAFPSNKMQNSLMYTLLILLD